MTMVFVENDEILGLLEDALPELLGAENLGQLHERINKRKDCCSQMDKERHGINLGQIGRAHV